MASCSEDHTICIWEEQESIAPLRDATIENSDASTTSSSSIDPSVRLRNADALLKDKVNSRWTRKAQLSESRKTVRDVGFSPRHLGLQLASVSADGNVRIYEATDVFSLNIWQLQHTVQVEKTTDLGSTNTTNNTPTSSMSEKDDKTIVIPTIIGTESSNSTVPNNTVDSPPMDQDTKQLEMSQSEHGLTCLSWNSCQFEPAKLAVGGYSSRAVVLTLDKGADGKEFWREECVLGEHTGVVHDISWAPSMGRSYHLIATASRENSFKIHTLQRITENDKHFLEYKSTQTILSGTSSEIWRVAWNATGTVLATSSEDGTLALWRRNIHGEWKNVETLPSTGFKNQENDLFEQIIGGTRAFYKCN